MENVSYVLLQVKPLAHLSWLQLKLREVQRSWQQPDLQENTSSILLGGGVLPAPVHFT